MTAPFPDAGPPGDEHALLRAAATGDQAAFRELWGTVERLAHALCLRLTGNPTDAADALQDTQLAVWRNLHRFEARAPFAAWVGAIARNAARAVLAARARRSEVGIDAVAEPDRGAVADFAGSTADLLDAGAALAQLPSAHREALLLWVSGLTYDQVAVVVDMPVATVRVHIHRARTALRNLLGDAAGH